MDRFVRYSGADSVACPRCGTGKTDLFVIEQAISLWSVPVARPATRAGGIRAMVRRPNGDVEPETCRDHRFFFAGGKASVALVRPAAGRWRFVETRGDRRNASR